ncbi:MAG: hypothetical protein EAZ97_12440 [Bacteroidetes bacterium]|nr:MAG: hypothetical protein EAZ97_12440 [Bacteroidota bacterium]
MPVRMVKDDQEDENQDFNFNDFKAEFEQDWEEEYTTSEFEMMLASVPAIYYAYNDEEADDEKYEEVLTLLSEEALKLDDQIEDGLERTRYLLEEVLYEAFEDDWEEDFMEVAAAFFAKKSKYTSYVKKTVEISAKANKKRKLSDEEQELFDDALDQVGLL